MSGVAHFPRIGGAALSASREIVTRIEKTGRSNDLHDHPSTGEHGRAPLPPLPTPKPLSQFDTQTVPKWNGRVLSSPFVAQILGQVLSKNAPDAVTAYAAYGRFDASLRTGLRFDRKL